MYENWKILKSEADEKADEYAEVADWCNENEYHIELYIDENDIEWYRVVKNPEPLPPTKEEIREMRERAYAEEVDCITAHIQRLRDENPVPEEEISELIAERYAKVEEIKERYPYNENSSD